MILLICYYNVSFYISYPTVLVVNHDASIFQDFGFHDISTGCAFVLHVFKVEYETLLTNAVATKHFPWKSLRAKLSETSHANCFQVLLLFFEVLGETLHLRSNRNIRYALLNGHLRQFTPDILLEILLFGMVVHHGGIIFGRRASHNAFQEIRILLEGRIFYFWLFVKYIEVFFLVILVVYHFCGIQFLNHIVLRLLKLKYLCVFLGQNLLS